MGYTTFELNAVTGESPNTGILISDNVYYKDRRKCLLLLPHTMKQMGLKTIVLVLEDFLQKKYPHATTPGNHERAT